MLSALTWGVSWPPGYPLYTFLAHFFSMLPIGTPEGNVNGFSGLCHAAAGAVLFLTLRRRSVDLFPALAAVALMAFSPLFWYYSEVAEVRALNDLLAIAAAYCVFRWTEGKEKPWLYILAFVLGLGISHHPTYVLILPAIAWWLWRERAIPSYTKGALACAYAAAACAVPYLILGFHLHRSMPVYNPMGVASWHDVLDLFLRKNLGGPLRMVGGRGFFDLGGFRWEPLAAQAAWMVHSLWSEPGVFGALLALAGAADLWKRDRAALGFWGIWLAASMGCFLFISSQQLHLHDPEYARAVAIRFYLMPFLGLFALSGRGAQWLIEKGARMGRRPLALGFLALVCCAQYFLNATNLARQDPLLDYGRDIIESSGPSDIVILASDDTILVENYLDYIKHETGDRVFLNPVLFAFKPYIADLKARYPKLNLPPAGPAGLPMDWHLWQKLNPGRGLYSEAMFLTIMQKDFKGISPHGALLALTDKPVGNTRAEAAAFLRTTKIAQLSANNIHRFTQELYLARTDAVLLATYESELDQKKDADLISEINARFAGL